MFFFIRLQNNSTPQTKNVLPVTVNLQKKRGTAKLRLS
nr:MAG TPA: hypothetical protein [Caudoviricetes sp.]